MLIFLERFSFAANGETSATNAQYFLKMLATGDLIYLHEFGAGVEVQATFDTNLQAGEWAHVALVRDATANTVKVFVDGVEAPLLTLTVGAVVIVLPVTKRRPSLAPG